MGEKIRGPLRQIVEIGAWCVAATTRLPEGKRSPATLGRDGFESAQGWRPPDGLHLTDAQKHRLYMRGGVSLLGTGLVLLIVLTIMPVRSYWYALPLSACLVGAWLAVFVADRFDRR